MVSPAKLKMREVLPTLLELLYLRNFGFWFVDFLVKFHLHYNLIKKNFKQASCCYMAECYLDELLLTTIMLTKIGLKLMNLIVSAWNLSYLKTSGSQVFHFHFIQNKVDLIQH